jgi:hypothetical protein
MRRTTRYGKPVYAVPKADSSWWSATPTTSRTCQVARRTWLAELMRRGRIRNSFIPPKAAPRDRLRDRRKLVESGMSERSQLIPVLETATIKLASVASDGLGGSGRLMLDALHATAPHQPCSACSLRGGAALRPARARPAPNARALK